MTDINAVVDGYIAMWNETDPQRRRSIIDATWADDATYLDPIMGGEGHDGIDAMVAGIQERFPGHRFRLSFGPDMHNDRVRFAWELGTGDGAAPVARGVDFATVAGDGRLREVTGFLEAAPAAA